MYRCLWVIMEKEVEKITKKKHSVLKIILIIIVIIILLAVVSGTVFYYKYIKSPTYSSGGGDPGPLIDINYGNFEAIVSQNSIIQALPKKGGILLIFYNLVDGERVTEKSYIITQGDVEGGESDDVDLTASLPSLYIDMLNTHNFCSVMQTAKDNQELTLDRHISATSFAWKYKGVYKYRECFGF